MKIVIAPDSFKGSLTAVEAANSIKRGIRRVYNDSEIYLLPVGDGGEGTMSALVSATNGTKRITKVIDPLGDIVEATYGILGDKKTCIIEMATASGIELISKDKLSPLKATTYGTGQLIKHALDDGYTSFVISLGGSATNDGGAGMLQALGLQLLDKEGREVSFGGGSLHQIHEINDEMFDKRLEDCTFTIATDVQNPMIGYNGASYVFGPQKGATQKDIELLDANLSYWSDLIEKKTSVRLHDSPGAGAAGGLGGAFKAFFPAEIKRGIDVVLRYVNIDKQLKGTDLVITGEGKVDRQTIFGKTPMGVAQAAQKQKVPTIIMAGCLGQGYEMLYKYGVVSVNSILQEPITLSMAMENASLLLELSTEQVIRTFFYNTKKNLLNQITK